MIGLILASMEIMAFIFMLIILIAILIRWRDSSIPTRIFSLDIVFIMLGLVCDVVSAFAPITSTDIQNVSIFLAFIFGAAIVPIFAYYCIYQINEKKTILSLWHARGILISNTVVILLCVFAFANGDFFVYNLDGTTDAGTFEYVLLATEMISTLYAGILLIVNSKHLSRRNFSALSFFAFIPCVAAIAEVIFPKFVISYIAVSVSALIQYVIIQSYQIAESQIREKLLNDISRTDSMTGLLNRRAFSEFIDGAKENVTAGVVYCDVNGLKKTNDEHGHIEGDRLIKRFASIIRGAFPAADIYRISGDEFVVICAGETMRSSYDRGVEKMKYILAENDEIASFGTVYDIDADIRQIINEAEKCMYANKAEYYQRTGNDRRQS